MHECVGKLLRMEVEYKTPLVRPNWREKYPDDEDVECCCKLLASTGPRLDVKREQDSQLSKRHRSREGAPAGLSIIGLYFHVLSIISSDKRTNARIRFMVMVGCVSPFTSCYVIICQVINFNTRSYPDSFVMCSFVMCPSTPGLNRDACKSVAGAPRRADQQNKGRGQERFRSCRAA